MKNSRIAYWIVLTTLLLANVWFIVHRSEGYRYYPYKTYSELYTTDSTLFLKDLHFSTDSVTLALSLSLPKSKYHVIIDGKRNTSNTLLQAIGNSITFPLLVNAHVYAFENTDSVSKPIVVRIDHALLSAPNNFVNEFSYCNLQGPYISTLPLDIYKTGSSIFSEQEKLKANTILALKTKFFSQTTDSARVMELAKFVSELCNNPNGKNFRDLALLSAPQQLDEALLCEGNLACGNYAAILHYLASVTGLPNRVICYRGGANDGKNWQYAAHYMNEIYLQKKQQWVLLDGVNNIYLPQDSTGNYINIVDVKKMVQTNSCRGKLAYRFVDGKASKVAYESIDSLDVFYNQSNANIAFIRPDAVAKYSFIKNFLEFYHFQRSEDWYSNLNRNNWGKIGVKMVAFYGFIALAIVYILLELFFFMKRKTFTTKQ